MTAKLDWDYDDSLGEQVAYVTPTLRIRAAHDDCARNPFKEDDGNWPMLVYSDRDVTTYDKVPGVSPGQPLARFSDQLLVFCQKQLADILNTNPNDDLDIDDHKKWHTDADFLRGCFDQGWDYVFEGSNMLTVCEQLYALLDIPCLRDTSRGYSQGDWAEVLVVATPEAQKEFGTTEPPTPEQLQSQVDLYSAWAWGDVYGYIVEEAISNADGSEDDEDEDPDDLEWEEIDDGSCWGYYGAEHDESGLEEAALEVAEAHLSRVTEKEAA